MSVLSTLKHNYGKFLLNSNFNVIHVNWKIQVDGSEIATLLFFHSTQPNSKLRFSSYCKKAELNPLYATFVNIWSN